MTAKRASAPAAVQASPAFSWVPCLAASLAMFLICMDTLIVNMALPAIEAEMGGGMAMEQWVVDGYTLPFAALLLLAGNLSDRFGARAVFLLGVCGFGASSLLCAVAQGPAALIAGRVLLGTSASLVMPSSLSIINRAYPGAAERRRALALWGVGGSAAAAVGPLLGGMLAGIHWSLVFLINAPFCVALALMFRALPCAAGDERPFDVPGQLLATAGLFCLVFGIIEGGGGDMEPLRALAVSGLGTLLLALFVCAEGRSPHPMMPFFLLRSHGMRTALFGGFAMILDWNGALFAITLYLQHALGLSSLESGLVFLPSALTCTVGNLLSDRLTGSLGARRALMAGVSVMGLSCAAMVLLAPALDAVLAAAGIALIGCGGGIVTPLLTSLALRSAPPEQAGVASALFNAFRQVGGAVGAACFGAFAGMLSYAGGLRAGFLLACALMSALFALVARAES